MKEKKAIWLFILRNFMNLIYVITDLLLPVFAAKTINGLYSGVSTGDFTYAYVNLALELLTYVVGYLFQFIDYQLYSKLYCYSYDKIQNKIYDKLVSCESSNFNETSKQKILSIIGSDVGTMAEFTDHFLLEIGYFVLCVVPFVYIFIANLYAGLIVVAMCFVNFFVLKWFNRNIAKGYRLRSEARDALYEFMNKTMDGQKVIREFDKREDVRTNLNQILREKHYGAVRYYYRYYSGREHIFYLFTYIIIYVITALLIYLVSKGSFDLETYLIIVPYLSKCIGKFNNVANVTKILDDLNVSTKRVDIVLSFSEKELQKFGGSEDINKISDLSMIDISYENNDTLSTNYGKISNLDISFKNNAVNIIKGKKGSGKRILFNMLRRNIRPDSGQIVLDGISIYNYSEKVYKKIIYYAVAHPLFLDDTIYNNLKIACNNRVKIYRILVEFGLHKKIKTLAKGVNTKIHDANFSNEELFILAVARAFLTDAQYLIFYELPNFSNEEFKDNFYKLIANMKKKRTIIIFTYSNMYDENADIVYEIDKCQIVDFKINKKKLI